MDLIITLIVLLTFCRGISGATFTLLNKCDYTVWPGILANAGSSKLDSTGFELESGGSRTLQAPPNWSGRFWGRTGCTFDPNTGQGSCTTGDCGSNQVECNGGGQKPPATLAEFTVGSGTQDFYDVSLVDGYNLPLIIDPSGGSGNCLSVGCVTDLNGQCPNELRVGDGSACNSACDALGRDEYCCRGAYGSPNTCKPSNYSEMFKAACPRAYSYAYDDATSTFTCTSADYIITFCPSSTSQKAATNTPPTTTTSITNSSGTESGEVPMGTNSSWLPIFSTGDSSKTLPFCTLLIRTLTSFLFLFLLNS